jgi:hypothetical protein
MATYNRLNDIRGAAIITYGGATFFTTGGVTFREVNNTFDKTVDAFGNTGKAKTYAGFEIEFTPCGEIESLTVLYPYANTVMGAMIYPSDSPLVIVSASDTYTFHAAAITTIPNITTSANKPPFGSAQFTAILKLDGDPSDINDFYTITAGAGFGTGFDPTKMITAQYRATLGALDPFFSTEGFEISFDLQLDDGMIDGVGLTNKYFSGIGCTISCTPSGVTQDYFASYLDGIEPGADLPSEALQIVTEVTGGLNFNAAAVQFLDGSKSFDPKTNRMGKISLAAKRTFSSGAQQPLFTIAAVA